MCDYSERLIAWMDGELAESEAAELEQHLRACAACRECVSAYEAASREFASYYAASTQAAVAPAPRRSVPLWLPVAAGVAAVAAAMLAIAFMPRTTKVDVVTPQVATAPASSQDPDRPLKKSEKADPSGLKPFVMTKPNDFDASLKHGSTQKRALIRGVSGTGSRSANTDWAMAEPAIQVAIPADAMFPPGAVPEDVTYIANVSLGTDGLIQGIELQP